VIFDVLENVVNRIKIELGKRGIIQPTLEIKIPKELIKEAAKSPSQIETIANSTWAKEWCRAMVIPEELKALTEEELKEKYPEVYNEWLRCRYRIAETIARRYGLIHESEKIEEVTKRRPRTRRRVKVE